MFEWGSKLSLKLIRLMDRLFDKFYGSKYNPLYQSGTLIVTLLSLATITGCYLLFFYRLSAPYESIVSIDAQVFLSKWVRNLHRYTSDLAVVVVIYHVFRMFSEGKTWGPRLLAWVTGVFLTLAMMIVGWTGFVMVWDRQGQALARAGATMIDTIPLFSGVVTRSISGATIVGASFFFLNLFIHMSVPLGLIFVLWLHTSKLNKPAWLLERKFLYYLTAALVMLSIFWSAPFGESADLLDLNEKYPLNLLYSFVILMVRYLSAPTSLLLMVGFFIAAVSVPFYWKPKKENELSVSKHNEEACTGCSQCSLDCPYGAIEMKARTKGVGSETVAFVDELSCVGCGICSASCSQLAIGPEDKSGKVQIQTIKDLKQKHPEGGILYVYCKNASNQKSSLGEVYLTQHSKESSRLIPYPIHCTGDFHIASAAFALRTFSEVYIVGCPSHACVNRLGQELLEERFLHGREPKVPGHLEINKIKIFSGSRSDLDELESYFGLNQIMKKNIWLNRLKAAFFTAVILSAVAFLSSLSYEHLLSDSFLRLAIRVPGQVTEVCRERSAEEIEKLPRHMRSSKECKRSALDYNINVSVDGQNVFSKNVIAAGARGDKPLIVEHDLQMVTGSHHVVVQFSPVQDLQDKTLLLQEDFTEVFDSGRAILVSYNGNTKQLFHSKTSVK